MTAVGEVRITGAEDLRALGKRLRAAGDEGKGLRKELLAGIRGVAKGPLTEQLQQAAARRLPARGGLAAGTAKKLKVAVRTRLSGQQAGVTAVVAVAELDLPKMEAGKLRHPTYGRKPWVTQKIEAGIFGEAVEQTAGAVVQAIGDALDRVAGRL